jgi:hypothetical protein
LQTTPEKQESFKFQNYVIICRVYKDDDDQSQRPSSFEPSRPAAEADEDDSDDDGDNDEAGGEHDGKRKSAQSGRRSKKAKRKQSAITDDGVGATFFKFEEEFYHKHASLVFACPVSHISPASAYADVPQARLAVVVAASKMKAVVADITDLVQEAEQPPGH